VVVRCHLRFGIFLSSLVAIAGWLASPADARTRTPADCPKAFAKFAGSRFSKSLDGAWARYNRALSDSVGSLASSDSLLSAREKLESLVADFAEIHPELPSSDFLAHVDSEWKGGRIPGADTTWSEFLQQSYARFLERHRREAEVLQHRTTEWVDEARQAVEKCVSTKSCADLDRAPPSLLKSVRERIAGTCMAKSPAAGAGLARELALGWSVIGGYYAANTSHKIEEFPFAFFLNSTIWAWVLAEKHCRNAVAAAQKLPLGKPVTALPSTAWGRTKIALKEEVSDWIWVPAMATTSVGISLWTDHWLDKERPEGFYETRFSYLVLYNAASGPLRRVLVLDPVFKKAVPALGAWADRMVRQGRLAEIVTKTTDLGVDYGLRWGEFEIWGFLYQEYMKAAGVSTK